MRITATVNGVRSCVLQNLIIATSGNGEATINGSQLMAVNANDVVEITAFHTGATGGNGSQGFPVNNNSFFNGICGIDGPVISGISLSRIFGISPCTLPKTSFIIFVLNCSEVTYLNVKKPPPKMPRIKTVDKIER